MEPTTYQTPGPLHLTVSIPSGSVTVIASDRSTTTLLITGKHSPDEITVQFDTERGGHQLSVSQRKSAMFGWRGRGCHVRVEVPEHTEVEVKGGSTDLRCLGTVSAVQFNGSSGDATVERTRHDVTAKVSSGDLKADQVGGGLTFHSASGDLEAGVVNGPVTARTASGDVTLGVAGQQVNATTVSGDIVVGVSSGTNVYLDLSAVSGSTRSDLPVSDSPAPGALPAQSSTIKAATVSGDIRVRPSRV